MSVTFAAGVNSALQLAVEPAMRGRVMALYSVVFLGSTPVGGPITGWLSEAAGPRAGLVLGGAAAIAAGIFARRAFARSGLSMREQTVASPAAALAAPAPIPAEPAEAAETAPIAPPAGAPAVGPVPAAPVVRAGRRRRRREVAGAHPGPRARASTRR
jgi:MFS family permease